MTPHYNGICTKHKGNEFELNVIGDNNTAMEQEI